MNWFVESDWTRWPKIGMPEYLTWAGFSTIEGLMIELADDDIAMLCNWNSERTRLLAPLVGGSRGWCCPGTGESVCYLPT